MCSGILVDNEIVQRIQSGDLINGIDGNGEGSCDDVIAGAPVIDGDGYGACAGDVADGGKGERAGTIGTAVRDNWVGDQRWVAGNGSNRESLTFIRRSRSDASQGDGLCSGILIEDEITQHIERGNLVRGNKGDSIRGFVRKSAFLICRVIRGSGKKISSSIDKSGKCRVCGVPDVDCTGIIVAGCAIINFITHGIWIRTRFPAKLYCL